MFIQLPVKAKTGAKIDGQSYSPREYISSNEPLSNPPR